MIEQSKLEVDVGGGHVVTIRVAYDGTVFVDNPKDVRIKYRYRNGEYHEPEFISDQSKADHAVEVFVDKRSPGQLEVSLRDRQHVAAILNPPLLRYSCRQPMSERPILEVVAFSSTPQDAAVVLHQKELPK